MYLKSSLQNKMIKNLISKTTKFHMIEAIIDWVIDWIAP